MAGSSAYFFGSAEASMKSPNSMGLSGGMTLSTSALKSLVIFEEVSSSNQERSSSLIKRSRKTRYVSCNHKRITE
eukprot:CAMPEP_0182937632 /NCGR_PEP_ID=MMETSP0105_2-20130417/42426_1 /TAXON_ID=81532 ORGANISM="Acanthoeca-like sp., Strain 10tr" /NCGR_SAMPLE_ID=MMETSP0105_2 /ASSEMBLY_ACC=CAM_ASM_000205 /LENGTH=74 /DNA_ID=CAMNT_0025076855 /DNA_START=23 /DNA_END=244 /DNA_ORIENTATION=+